MSKEGAGLEEKRNEFISVLSSLNHEIKYVEIFRSTLVFAISCNGLIIKGIPILIEFRTHI